MATHCFATVRGKAVRVTSLDECGAVPASPTGRFVASDGFVSVTLSSELETGDEFIVKNANGALCVNERSPDTLKRLNVEVVWCQVDPDLFALITGYPVELDGTDAVGFRVQEGNAETNWALEVWTGLAGSDACAGGGGACYGYLLVPFITGATLGDLTIENAAANFTTTGYTKVGSGWGAGPFDVIGDPATGLEDPIGATDLALLRETCVAPPASACGSVAVPAP